MSVEQAAAPVGDEDLVCAWQNGRSEDAFNQLCARYLRYVMTVIRFGIDPADVRGLGYWCLFKAAARGAFRPGAGLFKPYLAQVARRERISYLRRRNAMQTHEVSFSDLDTVTAPRRNGTNLTSQEITILAGEAYKKLWQHNRRWAQIVRMRYALDISASDTARALRITEDAVHTTARRGIHWLRMIVSRQV